MYRCEKGEKQYKMCKEASVDYCSDCPHGVKEKTADEMVILTPMYEGEVYKYHECSNCKKEIYFEEDMFQPFHFEENIKYCPFCGKEIIRYAKPKFIEEINWDWLDEYQSIVEKMYRQLEYKIYCKLDKEQIYELEKKAERGIEYFGQDRWSFPYSKRNYMRYNLRNNKN